ncbi:YggS family pyridoxal phosphate-dependent enzyme [Clostridium botulinum]|uniref:YggS family pyridoxal phosphate-dependent enzyme n=1 Tax=Clostridium botulinum TaxID=1491 RepID=UPI000D13DD4B|nr:YggS family pyridoxal phosphate-dependent enzyme [Clostridium botulinum]AVQ45304.1 YggS family pyridoxal phosphate-dependent enzyme [Clostridium botulinum]AVQ49137.1 YggS family pyridoxal phosphate-dependent enzyme [Clostridium botulinum]
MEIEGNINSVKKSLPKDVTLIGVSKTKPVEYIEEAYEAGLRDFGENKVQELVDKIEYFKEKKDIRWHLIGHLQRNKIKYIVGKVYLIHSLDSIRLLEEIEDKYKKQNKIANVLIQVNIGKEESKYGIYKENLGNMLDAIEKCENVKAKGLMAIIPKGSDEECAKYFRQMKEIFSTLQNKSFKNIEVKYLSMGMTGDYPIAIKEGSNMIRVGQGIFGKRNYDIK